MPCKHCVTVLTGFGIPHEADVCPLMAASYCSYCAVYGHFTESCPDAPSRFAVEPVYVEQLVAPELIGKYGIKSMTPLPTAVLSGTVQRKAVIELQDEQKALRAFARNCGIANPPMKLKTLHTLLDDWAKNEGKKIIYIQP